MKILLALWNLINPFILLLEGIVIGILFCITYNKGKEIKGWLGEKVLWILLRRHLKRHDYKILNNIYLHQSNGYTHQIDHIIVSQWGIFVIETKNFDGELVQCYNEARRWTYTSHSNGYYNWPNPIKQNSWHLRALADCLGHPLAHFHSIVAFAGPTQFTSKVPENVMHFNEVVKYIQSHSKTTIILPETVPGLVAQIRALDKAVTKEQRKNHNKQCQERHKQKKSPSKGTQPQPPTPPAQNCPALTNPVQPAAPTEVPATTKSATSQPGALGWRLAQELDNQRYRVLPDSLKLSDDIDATVNYLILSNWGIFLVVHLRYRGTVYGNPEAHIWNTEYHAKYRFRNPLEQSTAHLQEWAQRLQLPPEMFHSVIAFNDGATFKREMPENVMLFSQVAAYVRQHSQTTVFSQSQLEALTNVVSDSKTF